jgi:nicotinamidase-related amidase
MSTDELGRADQARSAMVVIDPLKRFTEEDAPFVVAAAESAITNINRIAAAFRGSGSPVVWTSRLVREQVGLGRRTEARYAGRSNAFAGRWAELDDRLDIDPSDVILEKPRHSAFFSTDLDTMLRSWRVTDVVITGFTTNVCCLATAFDAVARDYRAVFVRDALGARPIERDGRAYSEDEVNEMTFAVAEYAVGEIVLTDEIVRRLS